ncbi:MAG: hypothetical protein MPJ24_01595, partial [Pirellulaceae bacterium]|nr:hypothetical protein [Pirellulaceae bacterium]
LYAVYEKFPLAQGKEHNTFTPGQETILYAEVDNFSVTKEEESYKTSLKISYEIRDRSETKFQTEFPPIVEKTTTPRRDYFISHRMRIPKDLGIGHYNLYLTIEDTQTNTFGEYFIPFEVISSQE